MGSLTSRPNIPQVQQQPVIVTVPAAPPPVATTPAPAETQVSEPSTTVTETAATDNNVPVEGASNEEAQRLAREDNLLRRSRGRLSTVLTGFSGLLSQTVAPSVRKTLLGE